MLSAALPEIRFEAASIDYAGIGIEAVSLTHGEGGEVRLETGRVTLAGQDRTVEHAVLVGTLQASAEAVGFRGNLLAEGLDVQVDLQRGKQTHASLKLLDQPLTLLTAIQGVPEELAWASRGTLTLVIELDWEADREPGGLPAVSYQLALNDLAFDSPDGRFAGEALFLDAAGQLDIDGSVSAHVAGQIRRGELLLDNFYRDFSGSGLDFELRPHWDGQLLDTGPFRLGDAGALNIEGRAQIHPADPSSPWALQINRLDLAFPAAYKRYIEPSAAAWTLDGLAVSGNISWSGEWVAGSFLSGDLKVSDLSVVDVQGGRFAFTGLDAHHRPGDHQFDSRFSWRGLLFGRVNLGPGEMMLDSEPGAVALLSPLSLDVFDGQLNIHELKVVLPGSEGARSGEPDIRLRADLKDMDMERVTEAMGWPVFAGKISGEIPGVQLHGGVLDVDGEIRVSVFDGEMSMQDLRVERPFGVLPSLAANVAVENLDLELLTSTFSFGQISGRLDGHVKELRMLDWRPVAFDAWLGTPDRQKEKNDISRKAVNRLTTIGGGSATTALTSPLLRMFSNFSYRRLGLGCVLQNNICEIRGIGEDNVSVLILEGAGIPKITIRAFNRQVDWQQMVANLLAISGEESIKIGN